MIYTYVIGFDKTERTETMNDYMMNANKASEQELNRRIQRVWFYHAKAIKLGNIEHAAQLMVEIETLKGFLTEKRAKVAARKAAKFAADREAWFEKQLSK